MPTPAHLRAAVPHITHDLLALQQAKAFRLIKFGWITWYPMARNAATFLEVFRGSKGDIHASEFFDACTSEHRRWQGAQAARKKAAPPALLRLYADASKVAT